MSADEPAPEEWARIINRHGIPPGAAEGAYCLFERLESALRERIRRERVLDTDDTDVSVGDRARDRETDGEVVVVGASQAPASAHRYDGEQTVAEANPGYPHDDAVVLVVFVEAFAEHYPNWETLPPWRLYYAAHEGATVYSYPASRLEPVASGEGDA